MTYQAIDRNLKTGTWPDGAGYADGRFVPIAECTVSVLDMGFTRSDVTYDVAHVWGGHFFRLDHHITRFQASVAGLNMTLPVEAEGLKAILHECVRLTGLRDAYVAMVMTRGKVPPGLPRHPKNAVNRLICYAIPWVWVMTPEVQERGSHAVIAKTPRISDQSVNPVFKNYHWGDFTRAQFEPESAGADHVILLDGEGYVTEGPGFNVFAVIDGTVVTPDRGALEGITRQSVLDLCDMLGIPKKIGRITADELRDADEVFFSTTAGGVMPVSRVDGRIKSNDRPGPVTARLKEVYWAKHTEGWDTIPVTYD
ncbi:aminotransferase class IV [Zavarzinia sp. CC-PAN008]|uniref:aminotransferase class IV n=1 Tax=Zavarzinia sp. CC-PAN008 TaxID=3243332 RepID=UPI003F748D24